MRKKEKENQFRKKALRHITPGGVAVGFLIFMFGFVVCVWSGDAIKRLVAPADKTTPTEEWLKSEGNFAGGEQQKQLESTEPPTAPQPTEETLETQLADADPFFKPVRVPANCVTVKRDKSAIHNGKLLLLDSTHSYTGNSGGMGDFSEKNECYHVRYTESEIQPEVVEALNRLAFSYNTVVEGDSLMIYSTTSACSAAGSIYTDLLPDRETGYCVDLSYFTEEGNIAPMYSADEWMEANACNYGFVFSYTKADEETTGIPAAPYHLRYVGTIHALLMRQLEMTLPQYLEELKQHTTDNPLTYNDGEQVWSVYYVQATGSDTAVPVPKNGKYEISGNNEDGYIVLAKDLIG